MITWLAATGYRCFSKLDIAFPPYAVLAGANGTGKSTLLDIPMLIGDSASEGLRKALLGKRRENLPPRAESLHDLLYQGQGQRSSLFLQAALPQEIIEQLVSILPPRSKTHPPTHLRYELHLRLKGNSEQGDSELGVEEEFLDLLPQSAAPLAEHPHDPRSLGWRPVLERRAGGLVTIQAEFRRAHLPLPEMSPDRLGIAQLTDPVLFPSSSWLLRLLRSSFHYEPDCDILRTPSAPGLPIHLMPNAENLPWQVRALQRDSPEKFSEWVGVVRLALPNIRSLNVVERPDDRHTYLTIDYATSGFAVPSSGLSDGTLRILAFTILPYLDSLPPLLTVEQPEDGIHPRAVDLILDSLSALSQTQVLVTTHSPVVLARTELQHLICLRQDEDEGATAIAGPNHPRLASWRHEIDLGSLFAAGVLS